MKKTNLLGIKMTEDFRADLDKAALELDMTAASFARHCLEVCTPFPKKIWEYVEALSENYNKPHSDVIITIISKYLCDYIARQKLAPDKPYIVQEFVPIEGKPTLEDIFKMLQERALQNISEQRKKEKQLEKLTIETSSYWWLSFFLKRRLQKKYSDEEIEKLFLDAEYDAREQMWDLGQPHISELVEKTKLKKESDEEQNEILSDK